MCKMSMHAAPHALDLPPGFQAVPLREFRDAFGHAQAIAADSGAGTLVWVCRFDGIEAAVVLEPEQPLAEARGALYAGMNAAADALALHCPPEKPLVFGWPDTIILDGGIIGGCRLAVAPGSIETEAPDWLVLGLHVRSIVEMTADTNFKRGTSLASEGFEMMDGNRIIEGFARHLMAAFDGWNAKGFGSVADRYLARLQKSAGVRHRIDKNGDLIEQRAHGLKDTARRPLTAALATPQWLDPATGDPWL